MGEIQDFRRGRGWPPRRRRDWRSLRRTKRDEVEGDAALVLGLERAADIAEGARLALEPVGERTHEHAIQGRRMGASSSARAAVCGSSSIGSNAALPFRVGSYIVLFLL
jgi:hypothetical protein